MFEGYREDQRQRGSWRWFLVALVVSGLVQLTLRSSRQPSGPTVSFHGFGPVRIGMTVSEASEALGAPLVEEGASGPCRAARTGALPPGITFAVLDGRIVRLDVTGDLYRTEGGAGVGSTEREVRRLYPEALVEDHPSYRDAHLLVLTDPDRRYAMTFETTGQVVTSLRVGERGPVAGGCR